MTLLKLVKLLRVFPNVKVLHWQDENFKTNDLTINIQVFVGDVCIIHKKKIVNHFLAMTTIFDMEDLEDEMCSQVLSDIICEGLRSLELDTRLNLPKQ